MNWNERIVSSPEICQGAPCIKGTRIMVSVVLDSLAAGESVPDILRGYPTLSPLDIQAAIAYAAELARDPVIALIPGAA